MQKKIFLRIRVDNIYPTRILSLGAPYFESYFQISRRFKVFFKCQKNVAITRAPFSSAIAEEQKNAFFRFWLFLTKILVTG